MTDREWNRIGWFVIDGSNIVSAEASGRIAVMKIVPVLLIAAAAFVVAADRAEAKGCIKGAVVGGVAGHYAGHHGMLGAAAGCLYGRHHAKEQQRQEQQSQTQH
jgi:hypothetical protein